MQKRLYLPFIIFIFAVLAGRTAEAPRYIFYFIGDGMGMGQVMATEAYNRTILGSSEPLLMMQFPVTSQSTTYSFSSPVTDSAAAGTALATGIKTRNGMLGMDPDSIPVTSVARELADRGYGIALITSVPIDDATPGAFYAHVPSRGQYYDIGRQLAESGYDFLAGSNLRGTLDKEGNPNDLIPTIESAGYTIARGMDQLAAATSPRVLLLNPEEIELSQINFTIDSVQGALTLPSMTAAGIAHMTTHRPDRFFMMVEGGNIDYGGHANDGGTVIKETLNFQEALRHAYDFYRTHPEETLIIVTADHETGGLGLGNNNVGYDLRLGYYDYQKISKDRFAEYCRSLSKSRRIYTWEDMREYLADHFGFWGPVPVTDEQTAMLREEFEKCMRGDTSDDKKTLYNTFNTFTEQVFRILDNLTGLGWTTNHHSGGLVPVYAVGKGAELFAPLNDNTSIPAKIRTLTKIPEKK